MFATDSGMDIEDFNLLAKEFGIYILAHPICKIRIIQEPIKVTL
jgi:hypothetical protein